MDYMLLRTEQLTKHYGRITALDRLDLEIVPGEIVGILGPNGSGKSTALRLMLGFLCPTSGRASIAGHDCWSDSVNARRQVSYLPGELRLYENMNGSQLIDFLSHLRKSGRSERLPQMARQFDIAIDVQQFFVGRHLRIQHFVQPQRDVGIFGSIVGGAFDRYLLKTDAPCAFAGNFIVSYCFY